MPITDLDLVDLIQLSYQPDSKWDFVYAGPAADDLTVCVTRLGDVNVIVFPGTTDIPGWIRDFQAVDATPTDHPELGPVHFGFWQGMDGVWAALDSKGCLAGTTIVAGHSLGAARAVLLSGLLAAARKAPIDVVTCGEPRAGMQTLADLLAPVRIRSYLNDPTNGFPDDPVWGVPFHVPLLFSYVHPRAPITLPCTPLAQDPWGLLAAHHIQLYPESVGSQDPMPTT